MLVGCAVGGIIEGIGGGVKTGTFAFTSLLTIPVFSPMALYAIAVAAAFGTAFFLIVTFGYRTKEERAEALAAAGVVEAGPAADTPAGGGESASAAAEAPAEDKPALVPGTVTEITSPLAGNVVPLSEVPDPVFSSGAVGDGAGVTPTGEIVVTAPADGTLAVAPASGHAFGINLDSGVEILVHVGIDTVNLEGKGFDVKVTQGQRVKAGDVLVRVDRAIVEEAGYSLVTPVLVTNTAKFASVEAIATGGDVTSGDPLLRVTA